MNYEKLHKDTIAKLQEMVNSGKITVEIARGICADFIPENEDEKIRKNIISYLALYKDAIGEEYEPWIAWLQKQGEHANFINKIQIGDKVTRNEDGVLVNLSQLNRVAKKDEKQGEQKPAWSEEDEDTIKFLISHFCVSHCNRSFQFTSDKIITHGELLEKIRNLRPQSTWKPSNKHMKALYHIIEDNGLTKCKSENEIAIEDLVGQLEKLRK